MNVTLVNILVEKVRAKEVLEQEIAELKKEIERELPAEGFKNDQVTISRKKASKSISIDLKKLQAAEPDCYEGLINDYPKITEKAASVSYTFKKDK